MIYICGENTPSPIINNIVNMTVVPKNIQKVYLHIDVEYEVF